MRLSSINAAPSSKFTHGRWIETGLQRAISTRQQCRASAIVLSQSSPACPSRQEDLELAEEVILVSLAVRHHLGGPAICARHLYGVQPAL